MRTAYAPTSPLVHTNHLGTLNKIDGENLANSSDLATTAGLNYTVSYEMPYRYIPEITPEGDMTGKFLPMTTRKGDTPGYWPHAIFRNGNVVAMHKSVGKNYTGEGEIEKLVDLAWSIQQAGIATVEYAGQIKEYSAAIIQMRFERETEILGDRYVNNLQIGTSFVGEEAFYVTMSARRFWCSNERPTINKSKVVKRQHRRIEGNWTVGDIAQEIAMLTPQHDKYFEALKRMHETTLQPGDFSRYMTELFGNAPNPDDYRDRVTGRVDDTRYQSAQTRYINRTDAWALAYNSSANSAVSGTVAGLYEATLQNIQYATDGKGRSKQGALAAITGKASFVAEERKAFDLAQRFTLAGV